VTDGTEVSFLSIERNKKKTEQIGNNQKRKESPYACIILLCLVVVVFFFIINKAEKEIMIENRSHELCTKEREREAGVKNNNNIFYSRRE
jgi:hypothetical protein